MTTLNCVDHARIILVLTPGVVAGGFQEQGVYDFHSLPAGATLFIDDAPIERLATDDGYRWRWKPRFFAGSVNAEVVDASGALLARYLIDVAPDQGKLGSDLFQSMLEELHAFEAALLLGTESAQTRIGADGDVTSPLVQYARLRAYGEGLLTALLALTARPLTRLRQQRITVPLHRVRRIDVASAQRAVRQPSTQAMVLNREGWTGHGGLEVMQSTDDLDNPANRAIAATLRAVRARCATVTAALHRAAKVETTDETRTPLAASNVRRLAALAQLSNALHKLSGMPPFSLASRREITAAGLTAIAAHPAYARAHGLAWHCLRSGIEGIKREDAAWISPTWEIYERWCFMRVVACLREQFHELKWTKRVRTRLDSIIFTGRGADTQLEVCLQRPFRSGGSGTVGLRSLSLSLRPDIVIALKRGDEQRMVILDAKYRTSRSSVLQGMRSAHLYQDALRWNGARPVATLVLVPRGGGAPWLEAKHFQRTNQVGVHVIGPDQDPAVLREALAEWLGV